MNELRKSNGGEPMFLRPRRGDAVNSASTRRHRITGRPRCLEPHLICCPYCAARFDLFAATWCAHQEGEASKICPSCRHCLCEHPAYAEPHFWKEAPEVFQQHGFRRLFLYYL